MPLLSKRGGPAASGAYGLAAHRAEGVVIAWPFAGDQSGGGLGHAGGDRRRGVGEFLHQTVTQEADRRTHAVRGEFGQQDASQVRCRNSAQQPLGGIGRQGAGLAHTQVQFTVRVPQRKQHSLGSGEFGTWYGSRLLHHNRPSGRNRFGGWVGSGLLTVFFYWFIATGHPTPRRTDGRNVRTRSHRAGDRRIVGLS